MHTRDSLAFWNLYAYQRELSVRRGFRLDRFLRPFFCIRQELVFDRAVCLTRFSVTQACEHIF